MLLNEVQEPLKFSPGNRKNSPDFSKSSRENSKNSPENRFFSPENSFFFLFSQYNSPENTFFFLKNTAARCQGLLLVLNVMFMLLEPVGILAGTVSV